MTVGVWPRRRATSTRWRPSRRCHCARLRRARSPPMDRLPSAVQAQLHQLSLRLASCSDAMTEFLDALAEQDSSQVEQLRLAKALRDGDCEQSVCLLVHLHVAKALASGTAAAVRLETGAEPQTSHIAFQRDKDRVLSYEKKVRQKLALPHARATGAHQIDIAAANRFIEAASSRLTKEQRAALRSGGEAVAAAQARGERVTGA
eukprot:scaffold4990_cov387-Prasinococcus_capsulatus_cf.AAC.41